MTAAAHRLPTLFVSHGAPSFALDPGIAGPGLTALGRRLPRPRAVLVVSPHWMTRTPMVGTVARPETIHDFGGFAPALHQLQYPAPGHPPLAERALALLQQAGWAPTADDRRGLDHGAWVPLMHLFPDADMPVFQVSLPGHLDAEAAWAFGQALAPLAAEGVLVIGSGSLTHNLYEFRGGQGDDEAYVGAFAAWVEQSPEIGEIGAGMQLGPNAFHACDALGIGEQARSHAVHTDCMVMHDAIDESLIGRIDTGEAFRQRFGKPYATPTLWAAIQYLMPGENAPEHRHSQHAFRFVVEGEGVWTVVGGDAVRMSRGDFLPQAGMNWHAHHNAATQPMAWIDGLDIPFSYYTESQFFEFGRHQLSPAELTTPQRSRSERLWGHPGLRPVSQTEALPASPLLAYRWVDTDRALSDQLALEDEGHAATLSPGHAAVRFTNPTNGRDVLPTIRTEMHRLRAGARSRTWREVGSSVFQVFEGQGTVQVGERRWNVARGDMFVVPSWVPFCAQADAGGALDLFRFGDAPIFEALHAHRVQFDDDSGQA